MHLKILLPYQIFLDDTNVTKIVADTSIGSMGILPHRLDFVAALTPGILVWETDDQQKHFAAIDSGIMVKTGADMLISVRDAIAGTDLATLHDTVSKQFVIRDAEETTVRSAISGLEVGLSKRLAELHNG